MRSLRRKRSGQSKISYTCDKCKITTHDFMIAIGFIDSNIHLCYECEQITLRKE